MTLPLLWPDPPEPFGPARAAHDWMRHAACAGRDIDPAWFTSDEDDTTAIEHARQVCAGCPVRLLCRLHAELHQPYGV